MGKHIKSNDIFDIQTMGLLSELEIIEIYKSNIEGYKYYSPIENAEKRRKAKIKLFDHLMDGNWAGIIPEYYHEAYKNCIIDLMEIVSDFEEG